MQFAHGVLLILGFHCGSLLIWILCRVGGGSVTDVLEAHAASVFKDKKS
jgi:hypothetical protein